ncbi:hypothetical protein RRF57_010144 [Xylaria bambusicola]|uniref:Nop14-like family protein n=1 Tax=Xylaria bambusicola TaxID=326684 RepID=A0AAN7ZCH6_9PEZI
MPGSQLQRLKASLREQGVIGPQQSKKQRRKAAQNGKVNTNNRAAALESIRDEFNPFDFKHNARGPKFQVTSNRPTLGNEAKGITGRPGDAKAMGEERRRQTLLVEMNRRNKTGGIRDQRFGENDASMTYEEKMAQRFMREKQTHHKASIFDLEDDEPMDALTHMGKSLSFPDKDDFEESDLLGLQESDSDKDSTADSRGLKRIRESEDVEEQGGANVEGEPERKKTKQEIYKEIIAKSKLHKAERQAQKDADEHLREELDEELSDIQALLFQKTKLISGEQDETITKPDEFGREKMERDYDLQLRQLAMDRRAKPSDRTLTEEEIARRDFEKLKEVEDKRQKRMRGELSDGEDNNEEKDVRDTQSNATKLAWHDEEEEGDFMLGSGIRTRPTATELGFDDEDDFIVESDLLASGSDLEPIESEDEYSSVKEEEEDQEDEFTKVLLNETKSQDPALSKESNDPNNETDRISSCPENLPQLLDMTCALSPEQIPILIQKIRRLYHPKLASENKTKLASFSRVLVQYLFHLPNTASPLPWASLENIIRHLHSLAKSFPVDISEGFRSQINDFAIRCLSPTLGDMVILMAVGTIFPPSDAFHPVITPAMLLIARYLGQKIPKTTKDFVQGVFMGSLVLHYQKLSQRYCPEFVNFSLNTLVSLVPSQAIKKKVNFPQHELASGMSIAGASKIEVRKLKVIDCVTEPTSEKIDLSIRVVTLDTTVQLLDTATQLYASKPAFIETFEPVLFALRHMTESSCKPHLPAILIDHVTRLQTKLQNMLAISQLARRPLELHHHRPLAIKSAIPKFEDQFDPDRHYDADKDRAELAKLKAEHKKERKGTMRELRKDANFMAREKLRMKKQKDAAYEKKYKRLVAEIQGEEGREANTYEREKQARKRAAKR